MPRLSNDAFLTELTKMSKRTFSTGTVSISFKRYNDGVNCFPKKKDATVDSLKNRCLLRAVCQNKKISTVVELKDVPVFNTAISGVLRGSIKHLERRKKKAKQASQ